MGVKPATQGNRFIISSMGAAFLQRRQAGALWLFDHAGHNKFRRLLVRWERKVEHYEAMVHLACVLILRFLQSIDDFDPDL
jgi:hypothetical protein